MGHRISGSISALAAATAAVLFAPSPVAGQGNTRVAAKTWAVPHTPDGKAGPARAVDECHHHTL